MRKDIADMWADALRSGRYQQTQETLRDESGYCCLGVLCDLHRKATGMGHWCGYGYGPAGLTEGGSETVLPDCVCEWADIATDPEDPETGEFFTALNDREGYTFVRLADLIQEQWENL